MAPNVQGLLFKDMKQVLRKEQCDAAILITANVPSAKKIVVHGPPEPDSAGIPSQFPVQEDTQFSQILQESLDFFSIDENKQREYFLVDLRTSLLITVQLTFTFSNVRPYDLFRSNSQSISVCERLLLLQTIPEPATEPSPYGSRSCSWCSSKTSFYWEDVRAWQNSTSNGRPQDWPGNTHTQFMPQFAVFNSIIAYLIYSRRLSLAFCSFTRNWWSYRLSRGKLWKQI